VKLDLQHILALIAAPCATAFLDYLVNSAKPFSPAVLEHALLATGLVAVAVFDKGVLHPPAPPSPPAIPPPVPVDMPK
jgi:hypothetical protein